MPAIQFDAVSFAQPTGAVIFDNLTLGVDAGEVVALVGRSGAGKTTLLRLVNRLALPQSGRVLVDGRDTREWDPIRLRRADRLRHPGRRPVPAHDRRRQHRRRAASRSDGRRRAIEARVGELLELVGLSPETHAGRWPDELSGGQRQRVGVARALAADPAVLLMDEPFGALDPITRAELQREFRGIQSRLHKTVIIVTHDMLEALSLAIAWRCSRRDA